MKILKQSLDFLSAITVGSTTCVTENSRLWRYVLENLDLYHTTEHFKRLLTFSMFIGENNKNYKRATLLFSINVGKIV